MTTKLLLPLSLLFISCGGPSHNNMADTDSERDIMTRKLITFQQSYDRLDYNGNGSLSRGEVTNGIKNGEFHEVTTDRVPLIFAFYDTNKDDRISLEEVNAGFEKGPDAALRLKASREAQ